MQLALPKVYLLLLTSVTVLLWVGFFVRSHYKERTKVNTNIYFSYVLYAVFIVLWILSNAYFQSSLLVRFNENMAIIMAIIANITSYLAFAFAFLFSCYLSSNRTDKKLSPWQFWLATTATVLAFILNLTPNQTVTGVDIVSPGNFTIEFGPFAPFFFANAFLFIILTIFNFIKLRKSDIKLNREKSIYLLFGIFVYMSSTIASQIVIPVLSNDFSYTWLPPALSITEALLIGYTLVYHRLYSLRYISYWALSYAMNVVIYLIPIAVLYTMDLTFNLLLIGFGVSIGLLWKRTLNKAKILSSLLIYKSKKTPVEQIFEIAEEFKYSSNEAMKKLALLLSTPQEDLLLVGQNANYNIFIPHLNQSNSALVKDELDYQLHYASQYSQAELHQVQKEMDSTKTALILPIFGKNKLITHLLISSNKQDGTTFSNEEITAIQWVLSKVQGYIESERKVNQSQALASSIAHEMRNPLSQLQYHFERIGAHSNEAVINTELQQGKLAIQRGAQLIDVILSESKGSEINQDLFKYYSISALTNQFINEYAFESEDIRSRIKINLSDDFTINVNDTLFGFILFNLLRNAIHYFRNSDSEISIKIIQGNTVNSLIFRDTGPGIDSNILPNIFDDFFTYNKEGGSGLGLSYCLRAMNSFGGNISCYSKKDEFTEFVLSFPKIQDEKKSNTIIHSKTDFIYQKNKTQEQNIINKSIKTILIVDDKKVQRMLIQTFIANDNVNTLQAENGAQAIDIVNNNNIDLILMDSRMPVMNGIQAAKTIKHTYPSLPIIALTGEADHAELKIISIIMDDHLTKPISKSQLLQVLDKWI
jgi:two-component system autoinducer 1 sensor kinase/phosphatase LuxN